jgi:hypothetical protein
MAGDATRLPKLDVVSKELARHCSSHRVLCSRDLLVGLDCPASEVPGNGIDRDARRHHDRASRSDSFACDTGCKL